LVLPVTLQPDVISVLTEVELGNVDAGVVHVMAAPYTVKAVMIAASNNASTPYSIATVSTSKDTAIARPSPSTCCHPWAPAVVSASGFGKP
jgi:hypothetical protein